MRPAPARLPPAGGSKLHGEVRLDPGYATRSGVAAMVGGGRMGYEEGGFADGAGEAARFRNPHSVVVAKDGTLYVSDARNHVIRRLRPPA